MSRVERLKEIRRISYFLLLILVASVLFMAGSNFLFRKEIENALYISVFEQNKKRLKDIVDTVVLSFSEKESFFEEDIKKKTREEILNAYRVAESLYKVCKTLDWSDRKIKKVLKETLRNYKFLGGKGYIFIESLDGTLILDTAFPELEGNNVWKLGNQREKLIHQKLRRTALYSLNNEGFVSYYWYLP